MAAILLVFFLIFTDKTFGALPILVRPITINRPIVFKPEFARFRFQNIATRSNTSKDVANYFNNDRIEGIFDPNQLAPTQRQVFNQLMADIAVHGEKFNEDILKVFLQGLAGSDMDIDSLVQFIMFQAAKDSNADLKDIMNEMQNNQKKKRETRKLLNSLDQRISLCARGGCGRTALSQLKVERENLKNNLDSLSEMGEQESLRLQMAMDRMSKMMSTLSNILKKISDTSSSIIQNLK